MWADLPKLLQNYERIVYRTGIDEARDRRMLETITKLRWNARGTIVPPAELLDVAPFTHELRLKKSAAEIETMRRAARVSREAHVLAMREARPGRHENEIDALIEYTFRRLGSTGPAYTNIVAGGANACILHYVENDDALRDGDLVLIDAGAEWDYYASDVTRTFPVNGVFNAEQRALYAIVLEAQERAIRHVKSGVSFVSVHEQALAVLCDGLVRLGLLAGPVAEAIEKEAYKRFYMHRTSHWLGLDVHDCGAYVHDGRSRTLEPGMVLTVEPGLYVAEDDDTVEARWRGIGIRIEDDVLVTERGHDVLTAGIPKSIEEIEAACRGRTLEHAGESRAHVVAADAVRRARGAAHRSRRRNESRFEPQERAMASSLIGATHERWSLPRAIDALGDAARQAGAPGMIWMAGYFYPTVSLLVGHVGEASLVRFRTPATSSERGIRVISFGDPWIDVPVVLVPLIPIVMRLVIGLARISAPQRWAEVKGDRRSPRLVDAWRAGRGWTRASLGLWLQLVVMWIGGAVVLVVPPHFFLLGVGSTAWSIPHLVFMGPFVGLLVCYTVVLAVLYQLALQSLVQNRRGVSSALSHAWRIARHDTWGTARAVIVDFILSVTLFVVNVALGSTGVGAPLALVLSGFAGTTRACYWARTYRVLGGLSADDGVPGL